MSKQRESQVYLDFFYQHRVIILVCSFTFGMTFFLYQNLQPTIFHRSLLLETIYTPEDFEQKKILTDQVVAQLRTAHLLKKLSVDNDVKVAVFKQGNLFINLDIGSQNIGKLQSNLEKVADFAATNFPVKQLGETVDYSESKHQLPALGAGFLVGFFVGVLTSLIKTYRQNF